MNTNKKTVELLLFAVLAFFITGVAQAQINISKDKNEEASRRKGSLPVNSGLSGSYLELA